MSYPTLSTVYLFVCLFVWKGHQRWTKRTFMNLQQYKQVSGIQDCTILNSTRMNRFFFHTRYMMIFLLIQVIRRIHVKKLAKMTGYYHFNQWFFKYSWTNVVSPQNYCFFKTARWFIFSNHWFIFLNHRLKH